MIRFNGIVQAESAGTDEIEVPGQAGDLLIAVGTSQSTLIPAPGWSELGAVGSMSAYWTRTPAESWVFSTPEEADSIIHVVSVSESSPVFAGTDGDAPSVTSPNGGLLICATGMVFEEIPTGSWASPVGMTERGSFAEGLVAQSVATESVDGTATGIRSFTKPESDLDSAVQSVSILMAPTFGFSGAVLRGLGGAVLRTLS